MKRDTALIRNSCRFLLWMSLDCSSTTCEQCNKVCTIRLARFVDYFIILNFFLFPIFHLFRFSFRFSFLFKYLFLENNSIDRMYIRAWSRKILRTKLCKTIIFNHRFDNFSFEWNNVSLYIYIFFFSYIEPPISILSKSIINRNRDSWAVCYRIFRFYENITLHYTYKFTYVCVISKQFKSLFYSDILIK